MSQQKWRKGSNVWTSRQPECRSRGSEAKRAGAPFPHRAPPEPGLPQEHRQGRHLPRSASHSWGKVPQKRRAGVTQFPAVLTIKKVNGTSGDFLTPVSVPAGHHRYTSLPKDGRSEGSVLLTYRNKAIPISFSFLSCNAQHVISH